MKRRKNLFVVPLHFLGSLQAGPTISSFGGRFRDGQYSLASFLFAVLLLKVPPCPAICKSGEGECAPVPYGLGATEPKEGIISLSRRPLINHVF